MGAEDTGANEDLDELDVFTVTPPTIGALDALEDFGTGAADDVRAADVAVIGAGESEAAEDCVEDREVIWLLVCVLLSGGCVVCVLGGGCVTVVAPAAEPPPPPQAAVNSGATNTMTAVVALSLRCQLRFCFNWKRSI